MRSLILGVAGAGLLCAAAALAQDNAIGPPALRDFQIAPKQRIVEQPQTPPAQQPRTQPPRPVQVAPPSPAGQPATRTEQPRPATSRPAETRRQPIPAPAPAAAQPAPATAAPPQPAPAAQTPPPSEPIAPAVEPAPEPEPADSAPPAATENGPTIWLYALPASLLALLALVWWRRRQARAELLREAAAEEPAPKPLHKSVAAGKAAAAASVPAPSAPRAEPGPRPWLEIGLKTTRASFTAAEAVVEFELSIGNEGAAPAKNLRIDVKLFNAGAEQDREIGSFFRTAGRESTRLNIPGIAAGGDGVIKGEVGIPYDDMRVVQLDGRALFIPVVAVNILYDWGEGQSGQSSKSYVVGRELEQTEKMGAFRVDQGPRIWRTVGQREHSLARRN